MFYLLVIDAGRHNIVVIVQIMTGLITSELVPNFSFVVLSRNYIPDLNISNSKIESFPLILMLKAWSPLVSSIILISSHQDIFIGKDLHLVCWAYRTFEVCLDLCFRNTYVHVECTVHTFTVVQIVVYSYNWVRFTVVVVKLNVWYLR